MLTERIKLNLHFKLSYLNANFALTLGYLNPALNNPTLKIIGLWVPLVAGIKTIRSDDVIFQPSFFANENCFAVNALFFSRRFWSL